MLRKSATTELGLPTIQLRPESSWDGGVVPELFQAFAMWFVVCVWHSRLQYAPGASFHLIHDSVTHLALVVFTLHTHHNPHDLSSLLSSFSKSFIAWCKIILVGLRGCPQSMEGISVIGLSIAQRLTNIISVNSDIFSKASPRETNCRLVIS